MIYQIYSPSLWLHAMYMICTWSLGVSLKIGCHPGGIPNQHWSRWLILRTSMGLSQIGDENPQLMSISLRIFAQNHQHKNIKFKGGFSHSFHAKPNIPTLYDSQVASTARRPNQCFRFCAMFESPADFGCFITAGGCQPRIMDCHGSHRKIA